MELSDEAKKQALEAAQGVKHAARAEALEARTETTQEMETGSPQTPGYQPDYGQTMKPAPQWSQPQNDYDRVTGVNSAARTEAGSKQTPATSGTADGNAFEQALAEKLQEATPASNDKSRDIDR
jgi:hypothetical protein